MDKAKRKRLEAAGWTVGTPDEFLALSAAESALVTFKVALARKLRALRERQRLTQREVGDRVGSSQSRVAKMEAADASVSIDLVLHALLAIGATPKAIGKTLAAQPVRPPAPARGRARTKAAAEPRSPQLINV